MTDTYWPTIEVERMTDRAVLVTLSDEHRTEQFFLSDQEKAALARQLKAA